MFYNLFYFLKHPLEIFLPFEFSNGIIFTGISDTSYHSGLIGILIAEWLYTKKNGTIYKTKAVDSVPSYILCR